MSAPIAPSSSPTPIAGKSAGYRIEPIDLGSPDRRRQVVALTNPAFGNRDVADKIFRNTTVPGASLPSLYLGAFEGDALIGFNAFISHDLIGPDGSLVNCYQSCWSATHPDHRGRGIFVAIVEDAKRRLREQGAGFIFGFPNANSLPIFVGKLGFKATGMARARVPRWPWLARLWLAGDAPSAPRDARPGSFDQNDRQVLEWKRAEHGDAIRSVRAGGGLLWGRVSPRRLGPVSVPCLRVGGVTLGADGAGSLRALLAAAFAETGAIYAQFILHSSHPLTQRFSRVGEAVSSEPLIVFDLGIATGPDTLFAVMMGIKDVF